MPMAGIPIPPILSALDLLISQFIADHGPEVLEIDHHDYCYDCPSCRFDCPNVEKDCPGAEQEVSGFLNSDAPRLQTREMGNMERVIGSLPVTAHLEPHTEDDLAPPEGRSFLSLPAEIRYMIYEYALIVGRIWPYRPSRKGANKSGHIADLTVQRPNTNLLKTCPQINAEASPILYLKNPFILPTTALTVRFFDNTLHSDISRAWVKDVYLLLETSDVTVHQEEDPEIDPFV
ncbi:hypothetical protein MMC30_002336 [Trapelia coarctata]|nr:hypothetical protein [Trapelia coarctata]